MAIDTEDFAGKAKGGTRKIKILRSTVADKAPYLEGSVVMVTERTARTLIGMGRAKESTAKLNVVKKKKPAASRPELFRQATLAISGGFKRGDPRRFSALR